MRHVPTIRGQRPPSRVPETTPRSPHCLDRACCLAITVVLVLLTGGCGVGAPAPPPTVAECIAGACVTTNPAQSAGTELPPPVGTPTPASSPVATAANATPVAFRSEAAVLGSVVWATGVDDVTRAPRDQVTSFATEASTIFATVPVEHIAAGTTIQAQWTYNRTRLESFDQAIVAERGDTGIWLEFHLALAPGETWPSGTYELSVSINGEPAVTGSVAVDETPP